MAQTNPTQVRGAEQALDVLAFVLSDARYGLGAYLGVYLLTNHGWNAASIGFAMSFGGLAALIVQAPLCFMVDHIKAKRALLAAGAAVVTAASLAVPLLPEFWPVAALGTVGAMAGVMLAPALASISLGIVGSRHFARRAGRNESVFHLGNGFVNVGILLAAPFFGTQVLFWAMGLTGAASVVASMAVPERAIDHNVARGLLPGDAQPPALRMVLRTLAASRPLLMFAACGGLFYLANGAMLGLVTQKLASARPGQGIALTAASAIAAQAVMVPAAALAGWGADRWGRKPLLLLAFVALGLRAVLYAIVDDPAWVISAQLLDGLAAGLLGALFPVVIADLTEGAGCFNAAQGAVGTVFAVGGVLSSTLAGWIAVQGGFNVAFMVLASIAALGAALFWVGMPETAPLRTLGAGVAGKVPDAAEAAGCERRP